MKRKWRLYLDTSVFGGCFDIAEGWDVDSRRVVDYCLEGKAVLLTSAEVEDELATAPERVRQLFKAVPAKQREEVEVSDEVNDLADAYLAVGGGRPLAGGLPACGRCHGDACRCHRVFKHIVRLDRIRGFNAVNLAEGYGIITILSPQEVNIDEE